MSDAEFWQALRDMVLAWPSSAVAPVTRDRLDQYMTKLDPRRACDSAKRQAARDDIVCVLDDLYGVLSSVDAVTRWLRKHRHAIRIRRQTHRRMILAGWEFALLTMIIGMAGFVAQQGATL